MAKKAWPRLCVLVDTEVGINTVIVVPVGRVNISPGGLREAGAACGGQDARKNAARKNAAPGALPPMQRPVPGRARLAMSWHQGIYTKR